VVHTPVFDTTAPPRLADQPGFGYMSSRRGNLPLEDVRLHADITGLAASVDLRVTFSNDGLDPIEATYVFPLPELAAVNSLQIRTGSTVLDGWLMERAKARDTYAANRVERDAAILEQEREDVVTIRVGTIAPHERVEVRLILHARLTYTDGQVLFRFPLVVAPRYMPGARLGGDPVGKGTVADTDLVPDASRLTPPVASEGRVRLSVSMTVASGAYAIDEIGCTLRTHISGTQTDQVIRIEALPGQRLDRDLVLRMRLGAHRQPSLSLLTSVDSDGQEGTFALTLLPPTVEPSATAGRDVVVVVDASSSMSGWRLPAARRAAARLIDSLTPADQFTVLAFADRVTRPDWGGVDLVQAAERNRFRAIEHLFTTVADGSPVLLAALETAAGLFTDPRRTSIMVVITAGQVGNEDQITAAFGPRIAPLRVHAVGIGATVNSALLRQLADAGRGQLLLAESDNALDDLMPALRRLLGPALLTDFGLVGDGIQLSHNTISPAHPPDIFSGDSVVITGRFQGNPSGCVVVSGTGMDGRPWSSRVNGVAVGGRALTQLWARAFLADLQRKYLRCPIEEAAWVEQLIVSTSLRFGVLCRLTALVAVSNAPTRALSAPREVIQSVELPADWVEPEPSLSPYATEYSRILGSSRGSAGGRSTPRVDAHTGSGSIYPGAPRPSAAPPMPQSAAQMPESAPRRAAGPPAAPPAMWPAPPRGPWASSPAGAPAGPMPAPPPPQGSWASSPAGPPAGSMPPSHGPSRRGRYVGVSAAVAAVALGGTVFGSIVLQRSEPTASAPSTAQSPSSPSATAVDPNTGAKLSVTLTSQGSGSEVSAQVSGIPGGVPVRMIVVGRDGTRHQIDQWVMNPAGSARRAAATVRTNEIASVAIEGAAGQVYVSAPLT
jgi:Ca-activated chloride channel homolog